MCWPLPPPLPTEARIPSRPGPGLQGAERTVFSKGPRAGLVCFDLGGVGQTACRADRELGRLPAPGLSRAGRRLCRAFLENARGMHNPLRSRQQTALVHTSYAESRRARLRTMRCQESRPASRGLRIRGARPGRQDSADAPCPAPRRAQARASGGEGSGGRARPSQRCRRGPPQPVCGRPAGGLGGGRGERQASEATSVETLADHS